MRKYFIFLILIILIIVGYNYVYKEHRDIKSEKPEFTLSADVLINSFLTNIKKSEKKYLSKTIKITGTVSEISKNNIILNEVVFCQFDTIINQSINNNTVEIKGRLIGYDDLLEQVKLDQCSFVK